MEKGSFALEELTRFVVKAKQSTFASDGGSIPSTRPGSQDMTFADGDWRYHDSFFGTADFVGREIVYYKEAPVWGMAYLGRVLQKDVHKSALWQFLKRALLHTYAEGRFLGHSSYGEGEWLYRDTNEGTSARFSGVEEIYRNDDLVYRLDYFGGLLR